ncbi:MAG TPA: discoidin domain-containing protein [Phycisphaerae bacterium]|nr:discoidin domain-containing protein [Phycisphaerae bacterium]
MDRKALRRSARFALPALLCAAAFAPAAAPENLALRAKVTGTSQYNQPHGVGKVADGQIAPPMSKADIGKSWAARGNDHPTGVWVSFDWPEAVTVAEVVYFGRTGWDWGENWKDCEVYLNDANAPAAKGQFVPGHGPQRVKLAKPVAARRLRLKLLSHYGGPNPGAAEIQVYSVSPPAAALGKFVKPFGGDLVGMPAPQIKESPDLAARLKAGQLGFTKLLLVQRHHIRATHVYTYHCEGQRDGGGLFVYDVTDGSLTKILDSAEGQILGCDLSYDGRTVLFSWRRKAHGPNYQLWRIEADGSGLRQLTEGEHHNYDGCWLPDETIVFLSSRRPQAAYCFFTPVGILYRMSADGSSQRRISANYLNDFTPAVLNDGRIIYGRWEYVDRPAIPIQSLWAINPDGTMLQGFFGNRVLDPATFIEPQAVPGTSAVLCTLTGHNGSCRGAIGLIDPVHGDNAQAAIRNLTPEVPLRGVGRNTNGPRGPYQTPFPVDEKYFLVSHDGTILLRDYERSEQVIALAPRDGMGFYNPRPLRARPRPPIRPSLLDPAKAAEPWAEVYLQDVYNGLEPHIARGEVKQIAVVQELARSLITSPGIHRPAFGYQRVVVSCGATYVPKKVWGFADVAEDGSAYFRVPAEVPIYFLALDAEGRAVQRMRSFTHLMGGEVQGCIGCHESRTQRPRHTAQLVALSGEPQELAPPEWGAVGFNYASIVQPVLDRHCAKCHNAREHPKGIDLSGDYTDYFNVSYEVLARRNQGRTGSPYVSWIPTYNGEEWNILEITPKAWGSPASRLAEMILAGHPDKDGKPRVKLGDAERRRVLTWIDLNATYYGTADTAHPDLPACRQMLPGDLQRVMDDVYARRCGECHTSKSVQCLMTWRGTKWSGGRAPWGGMGVRITNPHLNDFLLAPLAKSAGGTEQCGRAVFADTDDADYQALLKTFEPIRRLIEQRPRMDMPNATPAACCKVPVPD